MPQQRHLDGDLTGSGPLLIVQCRLMISSVGSGFSGPALDKLEAEPAFDA